MSGETEQRPSGWTVDTLKEYVEQRFTDQAKAVDAALTAAKQAVEKEERNSEKWRQSANEWRQSMLDREIKFASRNEVEAELKGLRAEIQSLKETRAEGIGSKQLLLLILALIGAVGTLVGIYLATRP